MFAYPWERKLLKIGTASHGVILPKEWVERMGLKKGDKIIIGVNTDENLTLVAGGANSVEYQEETVDEPEAKSDENTDDDKYEGIGKFL